MSNPSSRPSARYVVGAAALLFAAGAVVAPQALAQGQAQGQAKSQGQATAQAQSQPASLPQTRTMVWAARIGTTVTLIAEVDGLGGGAPSGTVTFTDGTTVLGTAPLRRIGTSRATLVKGPGFTCVVTTDKGVKCWGKNDKGQLGNGTTTDSATPVDVKAGSTGTALLTGVVSISPGGGHVCAVLETGGLKCWGKNSQGQLGDGSTTDRSTPVDVRSSSTVTTALTGVASVTAGREHTCALMFASTSKTTAGAKCWGNSLDGTLGDGAEVKTDRRTPMNKTSPVDVVSLDPGVVEVVSGSGPTLTTSHTCALTVLGQVQCWGSNIEGQLGNNEKATQGGLIGSSKPVNVDGARCDIAGCRPVPRLGQVISIALGGLHSCAVTDTGGVKCWGSNTELRGIDNLVIGVTGTLSNRLPVTFPADVIRGDARQDGAPFEVRDYLVAVASGGVHTCALTARGNVRCWGDNRKGQVGNGQILTPTSTVRGGSANPVGVTAPATAVREGAFALADIAAVAVNATTSCALTSAGAVTCWGDGATSAATMANVTGMVRSRAVLTVTLAAGDRSVKASYSGSRAHAASTDTETIKVSQ